MSPFLLLGCLSNSYVIDRSELTRLAAIEPDDRWQSVRAVQRIGGEDYPPTDESFPVPPDEPPQGVYVSTVVVHSHHHHGAPPPRTTHRPATLSPTSPSAGVGSGTSGSGTPTTKKGNGDPAAAAVIAAAVVVGAASGFVLAGSEGARYDGWVAVSPDEPLHLKLGYGRTKAVQLSSLSASEAASADGAIIYEGDDGRFPRLGRAPLDRTGFTMTTALHMAGIPQIEGRPVTGFGGYLHVGGNIANIVTLGMAATADVGDSRQSVLLATLAPELQVYPLRFVGLYGGYGWSFRNTDVDGGTRADAGYFFRVGLVGELPLTTRLALQARAGIAEHFFPERSALTAEGLIGLAIY